MGALYLIFWRWNYPHDRGTRPLDVHNFVRVHFTTRQVPAVALGILDHGFALHELFLIQKAA
jgi:hypothetical protein